MKFVTSLTALLTILAAAQSEEERSKYGVDVSFPMHHPKASTNYDWLPWNTDPSVPVPAEYQGMAVQPLGNRQKFHEELIKGCVDHYGDKGKRCLDNERERVVMSLRQPKGMNNYTELGYIKMRAPEPVFKLIKEFWAKNKDTQKNEKWPVGNTYVNHWSSPSYMVNIEDTELEGGGYVLKQHIWNAARDTISDWTGQQVAECSLYGIRVYKEGAVLATHVDRLPLVSSAIINVAQDVDEPWPLEVIGHDGVAVNVTMEPGDLVLYESHSVLHGRPFELKGRFMANVFIHFEPVGAVGEDIAIDSDLPQYVLRGSAEEQHWRKRNPKGYKLHGSKMTTGSTPVHQAATQGNAAEVKRLLQSKADLVNARDINGWAPIHEAARGGSADTIEALLEHGADMNARTKNTGEVGVTGGTPLWWALKFHDENHKVVSLLKSLGAKILGPGERMEL